MRKKTSIVIIVFAVIVSAFVLFRDSTSRRADDISLQQRLFAEKEAVAGDITVTAQPELLTDGNLQFLIQLTTHSGDLSTFDAEKNLRLKSGGEELVPLRAENAAGSGPTGHHRELIAVFSSPLSGDFAFVLRQLGDVAETTLQWP